MVEVFLMDSDSYQPNSTAASLLGLLYWQSMSGGELTHLMEISVDNFWHVTRSQIYRELRTLSCAGLIESGETGLRGRRPYSITDEGRRVFVGWLNRDPGAELFRSPFMIKFFFGVLLEKPTMQGYVEDYRKSHVARLEHLQQILLKISDTDPLPAHLCRLGIAFEELVLDWLDRIPWEIWDQEQDPEGRSG